MDFQCNDSNFDSYLELCAKWSKIDWNWVLNDTNGITILNLSLSGYTDYKPDRITDSGQKGYDKYFVSYKFNSVFLLLKNTFLVIPIEKPEEITFIDFSDSTLSAFHNFLLYDNHSLFYIEEVEIGSCSSGYYYHFDQNSIKKIYDDSWVFSSDILDFKYEEIISLKTIENSNLIKKYNLQVEEIFSWRIPENLVRLTLIEVATLLFVVITILLFISLIYRRKKDEEKRVKKATGLSKEVEISELKDEPQLNKDLLLNTLIKRIDDAKTTKELEFLLEEISESKLKLRKDAIIELKRKIQFQYEKLSNRKN
jgi:hypothetical protein